MIQTTVLLLILELQQVKWIELQMNIKMCLEGLKKLLIMRVLRKQLKKLMVLLLIDVLIKEEKVVKKGV